MADTFGSTGQTLWCLLFVSNSPGLMGEVGHLGIG
jgi:hypothetical protein